MANTSTTDEELEKILYRLMNAHNIAFNEIDPHGSGMTIYDGSKAVSVRRKDIENEAKQALLALINKAVIEARINELDKLCDVFKNRTPEAPRGNGIRHYELKQRIKELQDEKLNP